jgi:signal transduction histidine kinase
MTPSPPSGSDNFSTATLARQVAHDLRSPLAALLAARQSLGPEREDIGTLIQLAADRIKALADRLSALSQTAVPAPLDNRSARARQPDEIRLSPDEHTLYLLHEDSSLIGALRKLMDQFEKDAGRSLHLVFDTRLADADAWMRERLGAAEDCFFLIEEPLKGQTAGAGLEWILRWGLQRRSAILPQGPLPAELTTKAQRAGIQILARERLPDWVLSVRPSGQDDDDDS